MKILINACNLKKGGAIQVANSFINEIKHRKEFNFCIVLSSHLANNIDIKSFPENFTFHIYDIKPSLKKSLLGTDKVLDRIECEFKPEKVFSVFGPTYWKPKSFHICGYAKPQYIYKNSPFFKTLSFLSKAKLRFVEQIHMFGFKSFCDEVITESEDVSQKLRRLIPSKKVCTVTNYYHQVFDNSEMWDRSKKIEKFDGITLLTVSASYLHKNLNIIPSVINELIKHHPKLNFRFVITIQANDLEVNDPNIKKRILFLGGSSIQQVPYLYKQADLMFLPTLLECFSASYPEAMKMKVPILTSDLSFAKGLCGDAAKYFDPTSPKNIAQKIVELALNKQEQMKLVNNGINRLKSFDTASDRANKYLNIISKK